MNMPILTMGWPSIMSLWVSLVVLVTNGATVWFYCSFLCLYMYILPSLLLGIASKLRAIGILNITGA